MLETRYRADLLIVDAAGRPLAAVELKNRRDLTRDIAVQHRRNLLAHDALEPTRYMLLLSQDAGYLWDQTDGLQFDAPPSREFPMGDAVSRYAGPGGPSTRLGGAEFAAVVFGWLQTLVQAPADGPDDDRARDKAEQALRAAGLLDAMRGGSVIHQAAV